MHIVEFVPGGHHCAKGKPGGKCVLKEAQWITFGEELQQLESGAARRQSHLPGDALTAIVQHPATCMGQ